MAKKNPEKNTDKTTETQTSQTSEAQPQGLVDLQQRVDAVSARFGSAAEDERRRGERLAGLLERVERGIDRDRAEIERLNGALAEAKAENERVVALLNDLLAQAEKLEASDGEASLSDLEQRVDRLYDRAVALNGTAQPEAGARTAEDSAEAAKATASKTVKPGKATDKAEEPLELTQMIAADGELEELARKPRDKASDYRPLIQTPPDEAPLIEAGAVQHLFKRVNKMSGRRRSH